ncbi:MAG: hypothetical protein ACRD12_08385 [Acidimicrobiales bacterium]
MACLGAAAIAVLATAPVASASASASPPTTGAAFTSVNEAVDGTGHCKNGNPSTNCNIYDGKQWVWMSGGPATAYAGDGSYFFAVLEPGGQADPNDGAAKNLSDDYDAYTNRSYTVSGGVVSYAGSHGFSANKIRLADYADTPSSGGVYILATCSLASGHPVNASQCKYDAFKVSLGPDTPSIIAAKPLTVTKDAAGAYDNRYAWTIDKAADKTLVKQIGGTTTFTYTVTVTRDGGTISAVKVTGTITVTNPNTDQALPPVPVSGVNVSDALSDGTQCSVANGSGATLSAFETTLGYVCTLSSLPQVALSNTVTATWPDQLLSNGNLLSAGSADFTFSGPSGNGIVFTEDTIDECVDVADSVGGNLGTACGSPNPRGFTYASTVPVPANGCESWPNTAGFTTNDTKSTGSASKSVTVCGPAKTGALTIGFWKGPNGNSLISGYCRDTSANSLAAYLSSLGGAPATGPFADAAGKSCRQLVTYVNGIIGGASATNMNTMLRAQMLATALDVYFSNPTQGWTTTAVGKAKPPSNFFTAGSVGGFSMDTTAVCSMVDNLSTGTAVCQNNTPSTNGVTAGAVPSSPMTVQAILTSLSTSPSPYSGGAWYAGNRTKQEIAKNVFDQINNRLAFAA